MLLSPLCRSFALIRSRVERVIFCRPRYSEPAAGRRAGCSDTAHDRRFVTGTLAVFCNYKYPIRLSYGMHLLHCVSEIKSRLPGQPAESYRGYDLMNGLQNDSESAHAGGK